MIEKSYMACKITVPQVKQKILLRHEIGNVINNTSLDEIIYFVAPYGSGKTMAALSWVMEYQKNVVWVTLDEGEDSPVSFWAHLSSAILYSMDELDNPEGILHDTNFTEDPRGFLRKILVRAAQVIQEKILIIDGFRHIKNGGLLREIKELISNMLGCWRIVLIGRTELPPIFNDFLLKKHLRLITLDKLNFSIDEINEYFGLNDIIINKNELNLIYDNTDGWTTALRSCIHRRANLRRRVCK